MSGRLRRITRYVGCSRVTRRPIMTFISSQICPSDLVQVFAFDDDYSFGVLQSALHFEWFRTSSRLKVERDLRYSVRAVFETFPWPQAPSVGAVHRVAGAAQDLRAIRMQALAGAKGGLRELYRALELPGRNDLREAHLALDSAVRDAYGFGRDEDGLMALVELNRSVDAALRSRLPVTPPGLPVEVPQDARVTSIDCLKP